MDIEQKLPDSGLKIGYDGSLVRLDGSRIKHHAAFKYWLKKLKPGERLPRGKFFRNKKPGIPFVIMDEFHTFNRLTETTIGIARRGLRPDHLE